MKKLLLLTALLITIKANAQNYMLKPGDKFPNLILSPVINSPVNSLNIRSYPSKKLFIINLWGTWCSPCLPEMDALAKLQTKFSNQVQIIGLSNDPVSKLKKYNAKKPSGMWLASDTASLLYQMLNVAHVGECIVIDSHKNIVALLETDSVNAKVIGRLLKGEIVKSNGELQNQLNVTKKDPFGVDTLLTSNFTVRGYMKDQRTMGMTPNQGVYAGRRKSYFNVGLLNIFKDAYHITSEKQVVLEDIAKNYDNYKDKNLLYCFDLLVKPEQRDSLYLIMQEKLQHAFPIKARIEIRDTDVYVLTLKDLNKVIIPKSKLTALTYGFSGSGFDGKGVTLTDFANVYLSNEFNLPVINETGLEGRYDIKTNMDARDKENLLKSIDDIGFVTNKTRRKIKIMVLYANHGNL